MYTRGSFFVDESGKQVLLDQTIQKEHCGNGKPYKVLKDQIASNCSLLTSLARYA